MSRTRRVAINAQLLRMDASYRSAGIARYIYELLKALPDASNGFDLHVFSGDQSARDTLRGLTLRPTKFPTMRPIGRIFWEQVIFPFKLARGNFDMTHGMAFASPLACTIPSVVTVYDVSFILYPDYFNIMNRIYLKWATHYSTRRAKRVIAISENGKRDLARLFGLPEDKVDVVLPGIGREFYLDGDGKGLGRFRTEKRLPDNFLLYVGTLEPRKNIPTLIRAFARAKRKANLPHSLVIIGGRGWRDESIKREIEDAGLADQVRLPGFVSREDLRYWYRAAEALAYPSQYEGFGMPPLEAMASGTPVVTTNMPAITEAVGDSAILVDPGDVSGLAEALIGVLSDKALRDKLKASGREHARAFTWERAARETIQTYRRALEMGTA